MTDTSAGGGERPPRVLLLYYSYTGQAQRCSRLRGRCSASRGCEVHKAEIKFTDQRYSEKFSRFPMRRVWPDMLSVLQAQKRGETGEIQNSGYGARRRLRPDPASARRPGGKRQHADALLPEVR